jgi:hypothetical protein
MDVFWVGLLFMSVINNPLPYGQSYKGGFSSSEDCYAYYENFKDWEYTGEQYNNVYQSDSEVRMMMTPLGPAIVSCVRERN